MLWVLLVTTHKYTHAEVKKSTRRGWVVFLTTEGGETHAMRAPTKREGDRLAEILLASEPVE